MMSVYHLTGIHQTGTARMLETTHNANAANQAGVSGKTASAPAAAEPQGETALPNQEKIEKAIKTANEMLQKGNNVSLEYTFDQDTHIEVVKVIDKQNGETLRQFPPKDILGMIAKMNEMWGILVDQKA